MNSSVADPGGGRGAWGARGPPPFENPRSASELRTQTFHGQAVVSVTVTQ